MDRITHLASDGSCQITRVDERTGHAASGSRLDTAITSPGRARTGMVSAEQQGVPLIFPWQDRKREFSWLKATTLALMFVPAIWIVYQVATEQFGPVPLGGMTYWSGLSATALLLLALAVTPVMTIFRLGRLIDVRRMIGVTALAYTVAHIIIYFALRFWNFASIAHEMMTRFSLIVALLATLGLIALGATSLDAAVARRHSCRRGASRRRPDQPALGGCR